MARNPHAAVSTYSTHVRWLHGRWGGWRGFESEFTRAKMATRVGVGPVYPGRKVYPGRGRLPGSGYYPPASNNAPNMPMLQFPPFPSPPRALKGPEDPRALGPQSATDKGGVFSKGVNAVCTLGTQGADPAWIQAGSRLDPGWIQAWIQA